MGIMAESNEKRALKGDWNKRGLTTLFVLFSFLWLVPSGLITHFSAGTSVEPSPIQHIAMSLHWAASMVFFVAIGLHAVLNWKHLTRHIISKTNEYMALNKETIAALIVVSALVLLFGFHGELFV